jgi:hAT family C-terminal dimerisation region
MDGALYSSWYFGHDPMDNTQSCREVADWFKVNKVLNPRIQRMASDYLGVTDTSVPSEYAFSRAGATVSHGRARLGDDAVQAICELQSMVK